MSQKQKTLFGNPVPESDDQLRRIFMVTVPRSIGRRFGHLNGVPVEYVEMGHIDAVLSEKMPRHVTKEWADD